MRTPLALSLVLLAACSVESSAIVPSGGGTMDATMDAADTTAGDAIIAPPDGCTPRAEVCNEADDDCDGMTDEGFDTERDPQNCGSCGSACDPDPANAAPACIDGRCDPRCDDGFGNCDGLPENGCEAPLNAPATCGSCGNTCGGGTPLCMTGECVADCGGGTTLCSASTCADLDTDVLNCGECDNRCTAPADAIATCDSGSCSFACDPGFADCDGDPMNGCEADLTDPATCGACDVACSRPNTLASCDGTSCSYVCQTGFGDCDGDTDNGCENTLDSITDCGGCGVVCAPTGAMGDCSTGTCMAGACFEPFDDCNADVSDGCEVNLAFDETDCDVCGSACGSGEICNGRECYADCGGVPCMSGCGTSRCTCNSGTCGYFCSDPTCSTLCQGSGIICTVLGNGSNFDGQCRGGAECVYDLRYGPAATVRCENSGTQCSVDCRSGTCDVDCRGGAECEVRCAGPGCGFSRCDGTEMSCGGGRRVCNRDC